MVHKWWWGSGSTQKRVSTFAMEADAMTLPEVLAPLQELLMLILFLQGNLLSSSTSIQDELHKHDFLQCDLFLCCLLQREP